MSRSPVYPNTDLGNAAFANDMQTLRQTVEAKKLTGSQIVDEATKMIKAKEEAQNHQTIKMLLDNIGNILTRQPVVPKAVPAPKAQAAPTSRKDYFDAMKRANPLASDAEINTYLDKKGVPSNAVWNEGAGQWQLPKIGDTRTFPNGKTGKWDGSGWVDQRN